MSNSTILFTICSLFYSLMLLVVIKKKKLDNNSTNRIFKALVISNFIGILIELSYYFTPSSNEILKFIFSRSFFIYLLIWLNLLIIYVFSISYDKVGKSQSQLCIIRKKVTRISMVVLTILSLLVIVLPLYDNLEKVYSYGPSANLVYYASEGYIIVGLFIMFINHKKNNKSQYAPFFAYIAGGAAVMIIQSSHPEWLLMTSMETFITFLMYFMIESNSKTLSNKIGK